LFLKTLLIYLVLPNTWTWTWTWTWSVNDVPELNLVLQMSDFRYEIKETSLPVIRTEILTEKSGFGPYQRTTNNWSWFLVDPVDDDDWRDRPRTDPSSVSDLGTGLGFSSSNELISARLYRDSFVQLRTLYPVSYRVSSLVSRFVYSTWT
jgi:hypothetical protein